MKTRLAPILLGVVCATLLVFSATYTTFAQGDGSRAYKIGIVNLQEIMDDYEKRKDEVVKAESITEARLEELNSLKEKLDTQKSEYDARKDSLSAADRDAQEADIESQMLGLSSEARLAQAEHERRLLRLKKELLQDIVLAIETIGSEEDYHLILEADPETRTGVIYHSSTLNMTQKVVDRLNKEYKQ